MSGSMSERASTGQQEPGKALFYVDAEGTIVDQLTSCGLSQYSGRTQEELEVQFGPLVILSAQDAVERLEQKHIEHVPQEIEESAFEYARKVLPPLRYVENGASASFRIGEPYVMTLHTAYIRVGDRFFQILRPLHEEHADLVDRVRTFLDTQAEARQTS